MKLSSAKRNVLSAILSGSYTPLDLREFVQFCYDLALPVIRKKIFLGKLNLDAVGLKEHDIVYDCLADLFQRDEEGIFSQIREFFQSQSSGAESIKDEEVNVLLRRLVIGKVNQNIIRLYSEADPTLGKILRNLKIAIERTALFKQITRFNEVYLIPQHADTLWHLPPLRMEVFREEFSRIALVYDNIPTLLQKVYNVIVAQTDYQRAVTLVDTALVCKEVYVLGWEAEHHSTNIVEADYAETDIRTIVQEICSQLQNELYRSYVGKGKCTKETYGHYFLALRDIMMNSFTQQGANNETYFDFLQKQIPQLTKEVYLQEHRTILEYFAKQAKERLRAELTKE